MPKEIICVNIGQAGVQISNAWWELLCIEHGLDCMGYSRLTPDEIENDEFLEGINKFFSRNKTGKFSPRAINIDLEPTVIDEIRMGAYRKLWHPDLLITGMEDASNNFARGYYSIGKTIISTFEEQINRLYEDCESLHGFILTNSFSGGTGSGLSNLILDYIADEINRKTKISVTINPSTSLSASVLDPYNITLSAMSSLEKIDLSLIMDNEALYNACLNRLLFDNPTFRNLNSIISQLISSLTVTMRFGSSLDHDLCHLQTNLVPFPRIHFPTTNYSPLISKITSDHEIQTTDNITHEVFDKDTHLISCDMSSGLYMSCCLHYRGQVVSSEISQALNQIKRRWDVKFVDWCPTGFKIGISSMPPANVFTSKLNCQNRNCALFCNSSAIVSIWKRILKKFGHLYTKKAFVYWYIGEGMEESEFNDGYRELEAICGDYDEITKDTSIQIDTKTKSDSKDLTSNQISEATQSEKTLVSTLNFNSISSYKDFSQTISKHSPRVQRNNNYQNERQSKIINISSNSFMYNLGENCV